MLLGQLAEGVGVPAPHEAVGQAPRLARLDPVVVGDHVPAHLEVVALGDHLEVVAHSAGLLGRERRVDVVAGDRVDLVALIRAATPADLVAADALIALIAERGYDRGKDLAVELDAMCREVLG